MKAAIGLLLISFLACTAFAHKCSQILSTLDRSTLIWAEVDQIFKDNLTSTLTSAAGEMRSIDIKDQTKLGLVYSVLDLTPTRREEIISDFELAYINTQARLPDLKTWLQKLQDLQNEHITNRNRNNPNAPEIKLEDSIQPAFPFYNPEQNSWVFLAYDEPIPQGFFLMKEAYKKSPLVPGLALYQALSDGKFPLILSRDLFAHDWTGHLISYVLNPDYAVTYRELAQKVLEHGGYKALPTDQQQRLTYFNELLVLSDSKAIEEHIDLFHIPQKVRWTLRGRKTSPQKAHFRQRGYTADQIKTTLTKLNNDALIKGSIDLLNALDKIVLRMGGVVAEANHGRKYTFLKMKIDALKSHTTTSSQINRISLIHDLAALESSLLLLSEVSLSEWASWTLAPLSVETESYFRMLDIEDYFFTLRL